MNRRTFIKKTLGGIIAAGIFSGSSYYYAKYIEPFKMNISKYPIVSHKIPHNFNNFTIAHFSDTHIGFHFDLSRVRKLIIDINSQSPDLIVFTGDLLDEPNTFTKNKELAGILQQLHAPFGKYWVYGNHDHGGYGTNIIKEIMDESGFTLLKNNYDTIEKDNGKIVIAGIDDVILGNPNIEKALPEEREENLFSILLAHEPDYADVASQFPVDVQLSGHSHGGQIRLPFIGHLYTPIFAEKYIDGKYTLNDGNYTLYVNRGIGTTRLPLRLFCTPELTLYKLQTK